VSEGGLLGRLATAGIAVVLGVVLLAAAAGAAISSLLGGLGGPIPDILPNPTTITQIPPLMLALYERAAPTCPGLPWTVLAGIGTIESGNGTSDLPGVHSGANSAGAEGPMQFLPATFASYDLPVPPGGANPPSPYDPADAVYAAARDLCANGARNGADIPGAIYAYNHSQVYVHAVLTDARSYGRVATPAQTVAAGTAPAVALDYALAQVGTPYRWGGETPGVGFDCSGLVQAAYAAAGVALPRTAQAQYDATAHLGPRDPLEPGDLLFFGSGPNAIEHVGIYMGVENGQPMMVDAPHTGAFVRVESYGGWPGFVGASQP
jgi:cell wall-associated NlpC family hydrolase